MPNPTEPPPTEDGRPAPGTRWRMRPITAADDARIRQLILGVLAEFGCNGEGFAGADAELHRMHAAYPGGDLVYKVIELLTPAGWQVRGGGGFAPLAGSDPADRCAELRKMYFAPELRGLGAGRALLRDLLAAMRARGFRSVYLETTPQMTAAQNLYRTEGFRRIHERHGDTGHGGCDRFYWLDLTGNRPPPP